MLKQSGSLKVRAVVVAVAAGIVSALTMTSAFAGVSPSYSLFGDATLVHPGYNSPTAAQASYNGMASFGGVDFGVPAGLTVSQLSTLSTEYQFTAGSCGSSGGSPRLVATVTNGTVTGNINFYIGPPPNYTGCPTNVWTSTGNLAGPMNLVDATQIGGGFYEPYSAVQAAYGSYKISGLSVVLDGFTSTPVTAQFDNVVINTTTYTFESAAGSCKKGGWRQFTSNPGPFKNQGDCVSYFATGGKNR